MTGLIVWAQAAGASAGTGTGGGSGSLAPLALRRWFASLTLSSPDPAPSLRPLWLWLGGLAGLVVVALVLQGPRATFRQLFDLIGHARLVSTALVRLRRAWRVVAATIGMTVLSWTGHQILAFQRPQGRDDLLLLLRARSLGELGLEQGLLAALTPLRDVFGLGDNLPLVMLACILFFRYSSDHWNGRNAPLGQIRARGSGWETVAWIGTALVVLYRLIALAAVQDNLPLGGCLMIEGLVVPLLMLVADGLLLAWILVEMRNANLGELGNDSLDPAEPLGLMPGALLACLAALPARYLATAVLLGSVYLPSAGTGIVARYARWQLSWGLADVQAVALAGVGLVGAVAWTRGSIGGALRGYRRLLAAEGGHLAALLLLAGLASGALSALAYILVLALPTQSWVLAAADGYAHYATLPVGLLALAACVELGERALPVAQAAPERVPAEAETVGWA